MSDKNTKDEFLKQAGILVVAGVICRIIGILYRSPLANVIGDEGNGYYSSAYNIYTIILLVSSYSIPSAISKVLAQRFALEEYKNAQRLFLCAILYVVFVGGIASCFAYFFAEALVGKNSVMVLRVFAPTIFFSGILGTLRGYFQAQRTMVQTSISQIIEQIMNAVVSIGAAYLFIQLVASSNPTTIAIYGAMGSATGTGVGVLAGLLFMLFVYLKQKKSIHKKIMADPTTKIESYSSLFKTIICMVTPIILSTFIYNFSTSLNQTVFMRILEGVKGFSSPDVAKYYGIFAGKSVIISNIPIAMAAAMSSAVVPNISASFARKDIDATNANIDSALKMTMFIAVPSAIGLCVLARPVVQLLFPQPESIDIAAKLLIGLSVTVIFYSLSTLTNAVLQGIGKVNIPVINASIALVIQTIVLVVLLLFTDWNLPALVIATIVYSFLMCVFNGVAVRKYLGFRQDVKKTYVYPVIASIFMGIATFFTYKGAYSLTQSNTTSLVIAILVAVIVYFAGIIKTGAMSEAELKRLPKGNLIIKIARLYHLL